LAIPASSGFAYYDLYGAVFTLSVTPLATTLLAYVACPPDPTVPPRRAGRRRFVGALLLIGALCLCGRSLVLLGLSPVVMMSTLATLYTVQKLGLGASFCVALVCGLCYDPLTVPLFLLIALIYALLREIIGDFTLLPSLLGGVIYLLLCGDSTAFWRLMPSLIAGYVILGLGKRLCTRAQGEAASSSASLPSDPWKYRFWEQEAHHEALIRRLSKMSGAFSHLSEIFRQLEKKAARPSPAALRRLCTDTMETYCSNCPHQTVCLEQYSLGMLTSLQAMCRTLDERGKISEEELAPEIRSRCPHKKAMVDDINHAMTRLSYESLRFMGSSHFAGECDEIAHLLRAAISDVEPMSETVPNAALREAIRAYLDTQGIAAEDVVLIGRERLELQLIGVTPASLPLPAQELRQNLARLLGAPVSRLHFDSCDRGCLSLHTLPTLRADYVHRTQLCDQATDRPSSPALCGDTLRVFVSEEGLFYALVCDGMGKGRHAAMTSGAAGVFLERTLSAGVDIQSALHMLNHYLLSRSCSPEEEVSSTIDLFCLNLYTRQGYFLKSGAAPSLIVREGRMFRLCSHTLPIGILQAIDAQIIPFEVQQGDHILMMSDGVCDLEDGEARQDWLTDYLGGTLPDDDNALIGEIFALARRHGSLDDMSMISIRISGQD
jgi:serine/threonine protein phosphatase PrpC